MRNIIQKIWIRLIILKNEYQNVAIKLYKIRNHDLKDTLFSLCEEICPIFSIMEELLTAAYKSKIKKLKIRNTLMN